MYYMGQVAAVVSCDKVNKEYQVLAIRSGAGAQVRGESGTKGFMPGLTHPPIPLRFIFYFRLKLNTFEEGMSMRKRNVHFRVCGVF